MDRNFYRENIGDAEMSSQVASWAKNWAETFRREAWQPSPAEMVAQTVAPEPKNTPPKPRLAP